MKTMACYQLAGACEMKFHAETFEEMAQQSKQHGMEMLRHGDEPHMKAVEQMKQKMSDPKAMKDWMDQKRKEFNTLEEQ